MLRRSSARGRRELAHTGLRWIVLPVYGRVAAIGGGGFGRVNRRRPGVELAERGKTSIVVEEIWKGLR